MEPETFSYNARVIDIGIHNICQGLSLPLRIDCNGTIPIISSNGSTYIYVTNIDSFRKDQKNYFDGLTDTRDYIRITYMKGIQFDVHKSEGIIFNSYTYIPGTLRLGGYDKYASK